MLSLERGRERFDIFCSVCHGRTGNGLGMVVRRGFKQPTSFHDQRLRESPVGYVYDVITNGFGAMSEVPAETAQVFDFGGVFVVQFRELSCEVLTSTAVFDQFGGQRDVDRVLRGDRFLRVAEIHP